MNLSYTRDLEHNYLVICPQEERTDVFALRMMASGDIPCLLRMQPRTIDGYESLYYETDNLISLSNRALAKKLNGRELHALTGAMAEAETQMCEYLLDPAMLLLSGETVFWDSMRGTWHFVCCPFPQEEHTLVAFTEELTQYVDDAEEAAIEEAFEICIRAQTPGTRIRDLVMRAKYEAPPSCAAAKGGETVGKAETFPEEAVFPEDDPGETSGAGEADEDEEGNTKEPAPDGNGIRPGIATVLFMAVLLAGIYIRKEYILTPAGNILSVGVIVLSILGTAGSLFLRMEEMRSTKKKRKKGTGKHARTRAATRKKSRRITRVRSGTPREQVTWESASGVVYPWQGDAGAQVPRQEDAAEADDPEEEAYTTVLCEDRPRGRTAKLYSRSAHLNCHIPLDRLPFTLGKLSGCADYILRDESVSRLHAHIMKGEHEVLVKDLNSTNGTYLNGIRLKPNETVAIHVGDELCFGDVVFDYV
ncbi:MAG: FHA domain-containing protein [Lachnospiraceae bacterium]|nr:FHA domain-containing protein [Lachnospiraceae bacterium]